jgi:hypothetical protein
MKMKFKAAIIGLFATVMGAISVNAQTLGVNYVELYGAYSHTKVPGFKYDMLGGGLSANQALMSNANYGLDLRYGAGMAVDTKKHYTQQGQAADVGLVLYYDLADNLRIFARGDAGWSWTRVATALGASKSNSWLWSAGAGLEWTISDGLSISPSVNYMDYPDYHKASSVDFNVNLNWWYSSTCGIGLGYTYADLDSGESNYGEISFKYRY